MTERKAAMIANKVYAAFFAKQITKIEALRYLDQIEHYLSETAFNKCKDFYYELSHNAHMYK